MKRAAVLALRRELLVTQARLQRVQLGLEVRAVRRSLRPAALLPRALGYVRAHPASLLAAALALLALRRLGLPRALLAWRLWRNLTA